MLIESEGAEAATPVLDRLLKLRSAELDVSEQRLILHAYAELRAAAPQMFAAGREQIVRQWDGELTVNREQPPHVGQLGTSGEVRRELAQLLLELKAPQAIERTAAVLLGSPVQEDRIMGLLALGGVQQGWTPATRRAQFTALADARQFVGGEGMPQFIKRLREQAEAALSDEERPQLADLLAAPPAEPDLILPERPLVKAWKTADFAPLLADAKRRGDAARGAAVFQQSLCVRCHRVGARGPAVGPDLTHVAGRFSRQDILQSVLTPAAVVAENYRNVQVLLADGRTLIGRALVEGDYRSEKLRLAVNPLKPSEIVELSKREIVQSRQVETSPMPSGLLDTFDEQAVLDLLAFLEAGAAVK
jgi:putative heme-binding domain-containing protein